MTSSWKLPRKRSRRNPRPSHSFWRACSATWRDSSSLGNRASVVLMGKRSLRASLAWSSSSAGGALRPDVRPARRQHLGHAPALDLIDGEVVALDRDLVAWAGHPPHVRGHEAAERAHVGGLGELDAEALGDVVHQREAVEDEALRRLL